MMVENEISQYLAKQKNAGLTEEQVVRELVVSGWQEKQARNQTRRIFRDPLIKKNPGKTIKSILIAFLISAFLASSGLGIWYFFSNKIIFISSDVKAIAACHFDFGFNDINGDIAVAPDGSLVVVNYNTIARYHANGESCVETWKRGYQSDNQQLVIENNSIWVVSRSHNVVGKFDLKTGQEKKFSSEGVVSPFGIALQGEKLYLAGFEGAVWVYEKKAGGAPIKTYLDSYEKLFLYDVVPGDNDEIYVLQNDELSLHGGTVVAKYDGQSNLLDPEFLRTTVAAHLLRDDNGNWYITDSSLAHETPNQVKKYSSEGDLLKFWEAEKDWIITSFTVNGDKIVTAQVLRRDYGRLSGENKIVIYE